MGVARRAGGRMTADVRVGQRQGVDEAQRGSLGVFGHVVRDCILDILPGLLARDNGFGLHDRLRVFLATWAAPRTRSRKPTKQVSFTDAVGADEAPLTA